MMLLFALSVLLTACSGVPGLVLRSGGGREGAWLMGLGAAAGLAAAGLALAAPLPTGLILPATPLGGQGYLRLDPIGAFFLIPVLTLATCGTVFARGYWGDAREGARRLRLLFGLCAGFLVLLVAAAHALTFLLAWEGMALTGFLLVMAEDRDPGTRRAGWVYLAATHTGTLCLFAAFGLVADGGRGFLFAPVARGLAAGPLGTLVFLLFLIGFGFKAGIMPLHFWLPPAHAAAPSHVSSLMSGVVIKMGILGLVRILALVPDPPRWWGVLLVVLGALSGLLGVAFALAQHDLKRLLAYHSIENIGIILLGLGLGTLGKGSGHPVLAALGFAGALLHVLNHSLFKGLLFLGAGSVVHATGTRDLERLGGLARRLPVTAAAFLAGSWAICGLPPMNGFISEWLIYLAAFRGLAQAHSVWSVLALAALAMIGALAAACFAKVYGVVFLGSPRSPEAARAAEPPASMRGPMLALGGACLAIGALPILLAPALGRAAAAMVGQPIPVSLAQMAHLGTLTALALPLLAGAALLLLWSRRWAGGHKAAGGPPTWDCGYAAESPRIQYTASSFADGLVGALRFVLWPREHRVRLRALFPPSRGYHSHVPDPVLDRFAAPGLGLAARGLGLLRVFQSGQLPLYLLYVLITLVALLLWMVA
jgi:hydrogenase-4 component B